MFGFQLRLGRPFASAPLAASFDAMVDGLFRNGEQGWAYDNNDLSTLFQDAAGTTPVTGPNQPVGLQLDKSRGLVRGAELQVNGDFNSASGWTLGAGWTIAGGKAIAASAAAGVNAAPTNDVVTVAGRWYEAYVVVNAITSGQARLLAFNGATNIGSSAPIAAPGIYYMRFAATNATTKVYLTSLSAPMSGEFELVSFRELPGNHRFQATPAARPVLRQNAATGAYYLETDGSDDWMQTNSINFTGTDKVTLMTGVRKLSNAAIGAVAHLGSAGAAGIFALLSPVSTASGSSSFRAAGADAVVTEIQTAAASAPETAVYVGSADLSAAPAAKLRLRKDGGAAVVGGTTNGGTFGNYPAYFFSRGGTSLPFNGHEYGSLCVGRLCTAAEIAAVERLLAQRTGVTLA